MICEACQGKGHIHGAAFSWPCKECMGSGVASCCDAAGSGDDPYRDNRFAERACDYCGKPYRGPALYCSLECATDDL